MRPWGPLVKGLNTIKRQSAPIQRTDDSLFHHMAIPISIIIVLIYHETTYTRIKISVGEAANHLKLNMYDSILFQIPIGS